MRISGNTTTTTMALLRAILPLVVCLAACGLGPDAASPASDVEVTISALSDPTAILGFEDQTLWTTSQGTKSASTTHSQGAKSLALQNFTFTAVTSAPLATLSGVTATLLLDVRPPAPPAWGQVQVFVSIPSRNLFNAALSSASVAGLPATQFTTLSFAVPPAVVTALQQSYSDLTFRITVNVPQSSQSFLLDNLRFQGAPPATSRVEIQAGNVDDMLTVTVNQIRRKVWRINAVDLNQRIDVSSWFGAGNNTVRIQTANTGGPAGHQFQLFVDGQLVIDDVASLPDEATKIGIVVDKTLTVSTPNRPPFRSVSLTSSTPGAVYIDDVYLGTNTPVTFSMPQASYKLGLGVSQDTPPNYTGTYYEQTASVGAATTAINMTGVSPLPLQRTNSVVVVPIQNTHNFVPALGGPDPSNNGVLQPADVTQFSAQTNATRDAWFRPFSYGLATWNVTVLPMVTGTPLREISHDNLDLDAFLAAAGLTGLKTQYDRIVFLFSQQRADGTNVADPIGVVFAVGRQYVGFQAAYTRLIAPGLPSPFVLHEFLHNHEAYNFDVLGLYNGIRGLHGGGQHGYVFEGNSGETDFVKFYRRYMRGQIAELDGMTGGEFDVWPSIPTTADLWVGLFQTMRVFTGK